MDTKHINHGPDRHKMATFEALVEIPSASESDANSSDEHVENQDLALSVRSRWIEELIADHHAELYRFCYRLTGEPGLAEDVLQQSYLIAFQRLGQVRDVTRVRSWLFTIVRTTFLKDIRKRRAWVFTDVEFEANQIENRDNPVQVDSQRLQTALNDLPEAFRMVVVMHYQQQMSYREIAEQMEIPLGTVMSRLSRAKKMLKTKLRVTEKQFDV